MDKTCKHLLILLWSRILKNDGKTSLNLQTYTVYWLNGIHNRYYTISLYNFKCDIMCVPKFCLDSLQIKEYTGLHLFSTLQTIFDGSLSKVPPMIYKHLFTDLQDHNTKLFKLQLVLCTLLERPIHSTNMAMLTELWYLVKMWLKM